LRRLLIVGARRRQERTRAADKYPWVVATLGRRPAKVVAVALANKMARIAWAILAKRETYRAPVHPNSGAIAANV
jgi:transposase